MHGEFPRTQCCRMSVSAYISDVWNHSQVFTVIQYHLLSLQAPFLYPHLFSLGYLCTAASTLALSSLQTTAVRNPIRCEPRHDSELSYCNSFAQYEFVKYCPTMSNMFLWKLWEVIFSNPLWHAPRCGPRCVHDINYSNSRNTVAASLSRSLWTTEAEAIK